MPHNACDTFFSDNRILIDYYFHPKLLNTSSIFSFMRSKMLRCLCNLVLSERERERSTSYDEKSAFTALPMAENTSFLVTLLPSFPVKNPSK